ncbi:MAG: YqiA/YcfP family alpha/beta fold hydrolase [Oxalobacter sp.]
MSKAILYLHGFMSAPESFKAQLLKAALKQKAVDCRYYCPQLPIAPAEAVAMASAEIKDIPAEELTVIGSSLGGYYANWIAEQYGCRAVLLNPVIDPWRIKILEDSPDRSDLQVKAWLDFREAYALDLEAIRIGYITRPERYLLLAATGDELLDWHLMQAHYQQTNQIIIQGSNHGISDFEQYLPQVLAFCGIA